jgi:hypothetical protein
MGVFGGEFPTTTRGTVSLPPLRGYVLFQLVLSLLNCCCQLGAKLTLKREASSTPTPTPGLRRRRQLSKMTFTALDLVFGSCILGR